MIGEVVRPLVCWRMKFGFKFSNLCGTVYKQGNVIFTPDGNTLLSPVGNKITAFDLANHTSVTLPIENHYNIAQIAISPDSNLLISIDVTGRAVLINFRRRILLNTFNFKARPRCIQFCPNNKYLAIGAGKQLLIYEKPSLTKEFRPFVLKKRIVSHTDDITSLTWSSDSNFIVTGSKDCHVQINPIKKLNMKGIMKVNLMGHRAKVMGVFFPDDGENMYTIAHDCVLLHWVQQEYADEEDEKARRNTRRGKWVIKAKHFCSEKTGAWIKVRCASYNHSSKLLTVGFSNGQFGLYELPAFTHLQTLSVSEKGISTCAVSPSGDWLAFGSSAFGQLLVWEWQAETYVMKQQGHFYDMNTIAYSPDGLLIASGGDDSKVKLWNTRTGFCFVTFSEHNSAISAVQFSPRVGHQVVFSASLDGTVRAFDLIRYRNFRIFTAPTPVQFGSLAVDQSGDIVCAGTVDTYEIFVWSVQTGKLLEVLAGHEGPVSGLAFSSSLPYLASSSWDRTCRLWDVYEGKKAREKLELSSDVLAVAMRPDGKELCTSSLDGSLTFWDIENATITATIEGRNDIAAGRLASEARNLKNNSARKHFTSISYSADGTCLLAGGKSKWVCLYNVEQRILLRKFQISRNLSLDGILDTIHAKKLTEAGNEATLHTDYLSDEEGELQRDREYSALPGAKRGGSAGQRNLAPMARTSSVQFSPTGRSWAAAGTEGLLIYTLDETLLFDPIDLDIDITPGTVLSTLSRGSYLRALIMSFKLNEKPLIRQVFEGIPHDEVQLVVRQIPTVHLRRTLEFIGHYMEDTPHVEFALVWCMHIYNFHGHVLRDGPLDMVAALRNVMKNVQRLSDDIAKICDENSYTLQYFSAVSALKNTGDDDGVEEGEINLDDDEDVRMGDDGMDDEELGDEEGWNTIPAMWGSDAEGDDQEEEEVPLTRIKKSARHTTTPATAGTTKAPASTPVLSEDAPSKGKGKGKGKATTTTKTKASTESEVLADELGKEDASADEDEVVEKASTSSSSSTKKAAATRSSRTTKATATKAKTAAPAVAAAEEPSPVPSPVPTSTPRKSKRIGTKELTSLAPSALPTEPDTPSRHTRAASSAGSASSSSSTSSTKKHKTK
eukprot:TRINITY_DN10784_c0_g2_i3.p1 TRINITY_DN10784_c0_g2~~TRINITY_DN10784_c0_g2_i3.p1  ORF type:complete len:1117 (+),score=324.24 TRINITY_DN10784_c0_g2_i3:15-3365(+)